MAFEVLTDVFNVKLMFVNVNLFFRINNNYHVIAGAQLLQILLSGSDLLEPPTLCIMCCLKSMGLGVYE